MHDLIRLPEDYNVQLNFDFLKRSPRELLHRVAGDEVTKLLTVDNKSFLVRITPASNSFAVAYLNELPEADIRAAILRYISEWFDLESDLSVFYALAQKDKLLKPLVDKYRGYRIVGQPDLFESLVWAVLGQQINLQFAYTLKQRFVSEFGDKLLFENEFYYSFPRPSTVAQLNDNHLLPLQFSRQKSRYTVTIAEAFATGEISKQKLAGLPLQEAKEQLMKIKGVGNWTANYALMKTFRYPDAFPLEDAGVHNAIKTLRKMNRKPTLDEVKKIFKKYKGWEAYATLYFWKSL
jgi:DNA-3-methyladenine glycosylase II